jgi:pilus assembly protein CpaC
MRNRRTAATAGLAAAMIVIMVAPVVAQSPTPAARPSNAVAAIPAERVDLLVGRSTVLKVDRPIKRVSLPKPEIADALVTSSNEVLVHGKTPGTISLLVWSDTGDIRTFDIIVRRDLSELEQRVRQLFPGEPIAVSSNGDDVVLSGIVSSKYVVDKATSLAVGYVEKADNVVNLLRQQEGVASNQILLRVRFAEVSRSAMQELGVSFFTSPTGIENTIGRVTTQQFAAPGFDRLQYGKESGDFGAPVTEASGQFTFSDFLNLFLFSERYDIGAMVRALQTKGLFQSLAEPNLVTQNGKEASFLAGGEYPYPVAHGTGGATSISIEFKEFGIRLKFTPTVLGNDLIHLKIAPEVSSLDFGNAVTMNGFRVPALTSRRTQTEVELRDGQTFAIAGLIDNSLTQTMSKVPGIGDIPVLGYLFRSRAYQKNTTELVVMITPQIIRKDSTGVTSKLPDLVEPYLGPERRTFSPPPPAFTQPRPSDLYPQGNAPTRVSDHPAPASPSAGAPERPEAASNAVPPKMNAVAPKMDPATMPAAVTAAAPVRDKKAEERARHEQEQRQRDEQKRLREEQKRAREEAEIAAKREAEEQKRRDEEQKKQIEQQKKQLAELRKLQDAQKKQDEEQQKRLAEQQKKAAELQRKAAEKQPEPEPEQEQSAVGGDQPAPIAPPSAAETEKRVKKLEEQRAEAERKKAEERKKAQQREAKRRALSDPYPPLRSRRSW